MKVGDMRKTYLVTYEFKKPDEGDYTGLYQQLKSFPGWWHYLKHTWLIRTDDSADGIYTKLKPHLDENVNLFIIEVGKDRQGWLPSKAWDWIKKYIGPRATVE